MAASFVYKTKTKYNPDFYVSIFSSFIHVTCFLFLICVRSRANFSDLKISEKELQSKEKRRGPRAAAGCQAVIRQIVGL